MRRDFRNHVNRTILQFVVPVVFGLILMMAAVHWMVRTQGTVLTPQETPVNQTSARMLA